MKDKHKARIGDLAARIRRATARLERTVARLGWHANDDQMFSWSDRKKIQDAGEILMAEIRRAHYTLGRAYLFRWPIINALHDGNVALTRARPLFPFPE